MGAIFGRFDDICAGGRGSLPGAAVEAILIAVLIAQRSLYEHVAAVAMALDTRGLAGGREAVRNIVGRDPMSLDANGVSRAAIESLAENFSDGIVCKRRGRCGAGANRGCPCTASSVRISHR